MAWLLEMGFRLNRLEVRETDTSVVSYSRNDWVKESRYFANSAAAAAERATVSS